MKTKLLMTSSALFCAIIGILLSFLPNEIAEYLSVEPTIITILFLKILSALYLGFGILNWMAKGTLIGGIYNRPIAIGNLMHFGVGAIAYCIAIYGSDGLIALLLGAYGAIVQLVPAVYSGLFWRKASTLGVILGLVFGVAVTIYFQYLYH